MLKEWLSQTFSLYKKKKKAQIAGSAIKQSTTEQGVPVNTGTLLCPQLLKTGGGTGGASFGFSLGTLSKTEQHMFLGAQRDSLSFILMILAPLQGTCMSRREKRQKVVS